MESRIQKTLVQWFPHSFTDVEPDEIFSDYDLLRHFAKHTLKLISSSNENKCDPFKIINLLYFKGTLYEKNAIENEFFMVLAKEEKASTLKEHLAMMPETIRAIYIKTILEN